MGKRESILLLQMIFAAKNISYRIVTISSFIFEARISIKKAAGRSGLCTQFCGPIF